MNEKLIYTKLIAVIILEAAISRSNEEDATIFFIKNSSMNQWSWHWHWLRSDLFIFTGHGSNNIHQTRTCLQSIFWCKTCFRSIQIHIFPLLKKTWSEQAAYHNKSHQNFTLWAATSSAITSLMQRRRSSSLLFPAYSAFFCFISASD